MSELITTREAADLVDRDVSLVRQLAREGRFPSHVLDLGPGRGRGFRYDRDEVAAWAAANPRRRHPGTPKPACQIPDCGRSAHTRTLCLKHYKQEWRGRASVVYTGRVETRADGKLICAECGKAFESLSSHVGRAHGITAADYRETHLIPPGTPLWSAGMREEAADRAVALVGGDGWKRLEAARDPTAASRSRGREVFDRQSETRRRDST